MPDFNPDQYLAQKSSAGNFDPDAYLSQKAPKDLGAGKSFADNYANTAMLGYMPQLVGKVVQWLSPSKEDLLSNVRSDIAAKIDTSGYNPYLTTRDDISKQLANEQESHPYASTAGALIGAVGSALVTPGPAVAKGILGAGIKGAGIGAAYGALSNPGDTEGQIDPFQWQDRLHNASKGALIGAVTGAATQAISKGIQAAANQAPGQAIKAAGALKKEFTALEGQNRTDAVGQFALDNGLVKAGDTYETVAAKAKAAMSDAGQKLDAIYSDAAYQMQGKVPDGIGFNPLRDKDEILSAIKDRLKGVEGKQTTVDRMSNYLGELQTDYGTEVLTPKNANDIESKISDKINWSRSPQNTDPNAEIALRTMRKIISDKVDSHIAYLSNDPDIATKLAEANKQYGYSSTIMNMARDRSARIMANNRAGLGDTMAGLGGAGIGAIAGMAGGEDKKGSFQDALMTGLALGLVHHYGGKYGNAAFASGLNTIDKAAPMASQVFNPSLTSKMASQYSTVQGQQNNEVPGYSDGGTVSDDSNPPPPPSPIDPDAAADVQASMRKAFHFANGGIVPGTPSISGNSPINDKVLIAASPGEIVLPNSVTQAPNAPELARQFVQRQTIQNQRDKIGLRSDLKGLLRQ